MTNREELVKKVASFYDDRTELVDFIIEREKEIRRDERRKTAEEMLISLIAYIGENFISECNEVKGE